jgi:palmitoyltransferase ZDHHC4
LVLLLPAPYFFTYLCAASTSSLINASNYDTHARAYPYDYVVYHPYMACRTCHFDKPARSKHCSICRACVAKCDHHCIWVNNCLGKENYRWFLALLLSVGVLEIYGAWLAWCVLSPHFRAPLEDATTHDSLWMRFIYRLIEAVNIGGFSVAGVGMLATLTAPLPLALLIYHVHLIWTGMTTNETVKWSDWREDMADGVVFKAKRSELLSAIGNEGVDSATKSASNLGGGYGSAGLIKRNTLGAPSTIKAEWPVDSDQILIRTASGQPPGNAQYPPDLWKRCWKLNDVDNIYDLGFWDNLLDVLKG